MAQEATHQLQSPGLGPKVRNLQVQVLQPDGTYATVLMQAIAIVDPDSGHALSWLDAEEQRDIFAKILDKLDVMIQILMEAAGPGQQSGGSS